MAIGEGDMGVADRTVLEIREFRLELIQAVFELAWSMLRMGRRR